MAAIRCTKSAAKVSQRTEVASVSVRGPQTLLDHLAQTLSDVNAAGSVRGEVQTTADENLSELEFDVTLDT